MRYYPIFLDLQARPVLVVGGGLIAEGKIEQLLSAGAQVILISLTLTPRLRELSESGKILYLAREFGESDLDNMALVISATDQQEVNEAVARAARQRNLLYNIVDQVPLCNFITPALVTRGALQIAISTGGGSPSVAQLVKRQISEVIGAEYEELLSLAAWLRDELKARGMSYQQRKQIMDEFLASDIVELLRDGRREMAEQRARQVLATI